MPVHTPENGVNHPYAKVAGVQPLPGYELIEPLGRGGFGEVWKCVAPGGLHKAIKFVPSTASGNELRQELAAFEQIKSIRHPFLLTLERVELIDTELVMVMELADCQLQDRFRECFDGGMAGIPRDELLGYLADAAEALDVIGAKFGLQHLDVKPANLFLTAGRVKLGDYGLVTAVGATKPAGDACRGLTPKYVAPEVLRGSPSPQSDQYSLALVYFELLTGSFPYAARSSQHMMLQHVTTQPDLSALSEADRPAVAKALAKSPGNRFGYCLEFIRELLAADTGGPVNPELAVRRARIERGAADPTAIAARAPRPADPSALTDRHPLTSDLTQNVTLSAQKTDPGTPRPSLVPTGLASPSQLSDDDLPLADAEEVVAVKLEKIRSVVPVVRLSGPDWAPVRVTARDLVADVVRVAAGPNTIPVVPGDFGRLADGSWVCRFPSTVSPQVVPLKVATVAEQWDAKVEPEPGQVVIRKFAPTGVWGSLAGKKTGLKVVVTLPKPGKQLGEVVLTGRTFGTPDANFIQAALDLIPKVLAGVRRELGNVEDRREHPRVLTDLGLTVYPLHGDGRVDPPVPGRCRDVSAGGVCFATEVPLKTRYAYLAFEGVPDAHGAAVLMKILRTRLDANGHDHAHAGSFRLDL
jgi:serine/threonine protein kinase